MANELEYGTAQELLEGARTARLEFCVWRHNSDSPGEDAAAARMLWRHIPEIAMRMGVPIRQDEGHDTSGVVVLSNEALLNLTARDMERTRDIASWLGTHLSPAVAGMFAEGSKNTLNPVLDAFAKESGFERTDLIALEVAGPNRAKSQAIAAHLAASNHLG